MPSFSAGRELQGARGLLGNLARGIGVFTAPSWMPAVFNQGQSSSALSRNIGRVPGMTPNPKTDIGRRAGNELQYAAGQLMQGRIPYAPPRVSNLPADYRGEELRLSAAARAAAGPSAGGGIGGGNMAGYIPAETSFGGGGAAERAYQQEKSRVAQLTAQDPELQRYEAARRLAATPGATPEQVQSAEDIGMAMWAKSNPKLAAKVQPGQAGFDVIQKQTGQMPAPSFNPLMQRTFGYQTGGLAPGAEFTPTMGPTPLVPQVDQALNPASPTFAGGEGMPYANVGAVDKLTPEMIEAYKRQLLDRAKP